VAEPLRRRVQQLEGEAAAAREELGSARTRLQTLSDTVDAANDAILVGLVAEPRGCSGSGWRPPWN
jgi:hypothetical protein